MLSVTILNRDKSYIQQINNATQVILIIQNKIGKIFILKRLYQYLTMINFL